MDRKKFDEIETANIFNNTIADATAETIPTPLPRQKQGTLPTLEFVEQARQQGKTQGRAGCTSNRINMAFTPDVHKFIQIMSRYRGETMTKYVNHIIEMYMQDEEHNKLYQQILDFRDRT